MISEELVFWVKNIYACRKMGGSVLSIAIDDLIDENNEVLAELHLPDDIYDSVIKEFKHWIYESCDITDFDFGDETFTYRGVEIHRSDCHFIKVATRL